MMKNKNEKINKISNERIQEIKAFRKLLSKIANENVLMLEPQRGEVRDILVTADRDTKKTSTALYIVDQRYRMYPDEYFIFVVLNDNMKTDITNSFYHFGWTVSQNKIYDPFCNNKLIGFIAAINTYNKEKLKTYRFFNITTAVWEELVPELTPISAELGQKISSVVTSIFGPFKLKRWKEFKIINYFLTNNTNPDYPLFYIYGEPKEEMGVTYGIKKGIPYAIVSLVNEDKIKEDIDPLLSLSGYDELAWSKKLSLNDDIYIDDIDLENYDYFMNIEIFTTKCAIYINDKEILLYHKFNKEDDNFVLIATNDGLKKHLVNLNVLKRINEAFNDKSLKFSRWDLRMRVNEAMLKYLNKF